jgi:uncharacterized protein YecT (DUF1311 family)
MLYLGRSPLTTALGRTMNVLAFLVVGLLQASDNPVVDTCVDLSFPEGRACASKVVEDQEQAMRSAYDALLGSIVASRERLKTSQAAWEAYRLAQCNLEHGELGPKLWAFRICSARLAKARAEELHSISLGCNACIE